MIAWHPIQPDSIDITTAICSLIQAKSFRSAYLQLKNLKFDKVILITNPWRVVVIAHVIMNDINEVFDSVTVGQMKYILEIRNILKSWNIAEINSRIP